MSPAETNLAATVITALLTSLIGSAGAFLVLRVQMRRQYQLNFAAEAVIRRLLMHSQWTLRSFDQIKHHLGGFEDDELRRLLVQSGALRFEAKGREMWGLFERTKHALDMKGDYQSLLDPRDLELLTAKDEAAKVAAPAN